MHFLSLFSLSLCPHESRKTPHFTTLPTPFALYLPFFLPHYCPPIVPPFVPPITFLRILHPLSGHKKSLQNKPILALLQAFCNTVATPLQHYCNKTPKTLYYKEKAVAVPLQRLYISTPFQSHYCSFLHIICSFLLIRTPFAPHFTPFEQFVVQCNFPPNRHNARHIKHLHHFHARPHIEHFVILPVYFKVENFFVFGPE